MDKRKRGNIFSSTAAMIQGNLDAFWRTPRTLLMMVFIVCCCFLTVRGYATGLARKNYTMNMEESIAWFLMTGFNSFNLTSVTFLIMVSELPRRIPFQQYTLIRSTRVRWIVAQMLYCLLLVVLMLVVLIALTTLMLIPVVVQGKGWSDNVRIAAGNAGTQLRFGMDSPESNADSDKPFVDCTDFLVLANHDMEYSAVRLVRIRAAGRYFV